MAVSLDLGRPSRHGNGLGKQPLLAFNQLPQVEKRSDRQTRLGRVRMRCADFRVEHPRGNGKLIGLTQANEHAEGAERPDHLDILAKEGMVAVADPDGS